MDDDRQRKLRQLFDRALDLDPEAQRRLLDEACADDPELRQELESLLEQDKVPGDPIGRAVQDAVGDALTEARTPSLQVGQEITRYQVRHKLGAGGMGEVFLARDTELRRDVALKVLSAPFAGDPDGLRRFKREARALAAVDHPNIVSVYSVEEEAGVHFLTMAYVVGRTLDQLIPKGGLGPERFLKLAVPLADAVRAAHERGIVHRDLKPTNVMVDGEDRLRVLDFGLAKLQREAASPEVSQVAKQAVIREGVVMGTFPYMSPEQVEGKPLDVRSDIFSLGVILYEMATGERPFKGETSDSLAAAILKETPPTVGDLRAGLPPQLARIVRHCLEKDPAQRPQTAKEIRDALDNLGRESVSERLVSSPRAARARSRLLLTIGMAVAILAVLAAVWRWGPQSFDALAEPDIRSLAVLPLSNLSGDPGQQYFVDGMTEALITDLAKVGSLKVISRTSVMLYRDSDKPLPQIARELGVDAVVEGSVMRAAEQVRVTVQLIEAESDEYIWAENYDREMRDVLSLQSEVARAIAGEIEAQLTPAEEQLLTAERTVDPEAYDAYLKGLFHFSSYQVERAGEYFELALERDPSFAPAYAGLANIWGARVQFGGTPPSVGKPKGRELVLKALELDDTLAEAHTVLAKISYYFDWDWPAAERGFQRALELNPNGPFVRYSYALLLGSLKRHEEGMEQIERALELDPLNPLLSAIHGWQFVVSDRFSEAIEAFRRALAAGPVLPAQLGLWTALRAEGRYDEALIEAKKTFSLLGRPEVVEAMDSGYGESGYRGAMHSAAERLAERSEREYVPQTMVARLYAHAREEDQAIHWLERAYEERDTFLVQLGGEPDWDDLRADSRFRDLLARIGLPE